MQRFLALCIVLAPVFLGVYGITLMRDTLFGYLNAPFPFLWLQFFGGLIAFLIGLTFIGGYILHRDRKRNKVQPRLRKIKNDKNL